MDNFHEPYYSLKSLQRLKCLCQMLRNNADEILAAKLSVTIASNTLYELNEAIDNLQDGLSPPTLSVDGDNGNRQRPGSRVSELEEWNYHLQLVVDIISKAPVLVLYKPMECATAEAEPSSSSSHSSSSAAQPIRLGYFTSLSHLEISCVPIQSIQDLLKMRERLKTFVVVNCASSNFHLQDVLEMCDQDVSVPMQWAVLKHLCVRNNSIEELDGSLRLCPRLELLDLSKNYLTTTDMYLEYLMELTHLDLSHNNLTTLPSVSATAKKKLRVLKLEHNKISSLKGIEEMTSLQELDMSDNTIATHLCLQPVKGLHRLDKLSMKGCPAAMKKDHRILALQFISTVSLSRKFFLDGHQVTHKEIQNSRAVVHHSDHYRPYQQSPPTSTGPGTSAERDDRFSHSLRLEDGGASTSEDLTVSITSIRKKKGRKKAKTRTMEIPDMDLSGGDLSSKDVTPSTTPKVPSRLETLAQLRKQEVQETRAEMEHLRKYYGENWLQAVDDQGLLPRPTSVVNTDDTTATTSKKTHTLKKSGTDVALAASGGTVTTQADVHAYRSPSKKNRTSGGGESTGAKEAKAGAKLGEKEREGEEKVFRRDDLFLSSSSGAEDGGASVSPARVADKVSGQAGSVSRAGKSDTVQDASAKENDDNEDRKDGGKGGDDERGVTDVKDTCGFGNDADVGDDTRDRSEVSFDSKWSADSDGVRGNTPLSPQVYSPHNTSSVHDTSVEPEEQGDPFIVTLPNQEDDPFILTVSPRYLVEKDINGAMKEKLDLQSLESVRVERKEMSTGKTKAWDEDDTTRGGDPAEFKVILDFSSIRKDRKSRVYVMEDAITAQHLRELVQPFVDAKVAAAKKKLEALYQCLKCSSQFKLGEATTIVYRESIPHTGSSRDFASLGDMGGKKEVLRCPKCQSDHVILMETEPSSPHPPGALSSSLPSEGLLRSALWQKQNLEPPGKTVTPKAQSTPKGNAGSSLAESQVARPSSGHKGSKPDVSRVLFPIEDDDKGQGGQGVNPYPALSLMESTGVKRDEESSSPRRRSNAFHDQPPSETRRRSDAVISPAEFLERRASSSATDQNPDMEESRQCAAGSVTSADAVDTSQLATFGVMNNLHLSASVNSSDGTPTRGVSSSVDSDIAILNKRDSAASVVVLSQTAGEEVSQQTEAPKDKDSTRPASTPVFSKSGSDLVLNLNSDAAEEEGREHDATSDRQLLTPVQQEAESVEVTPMGSPLSQSICSSMVSSVYNNSLLPNTSASDVYVSANEYYAADSEVVDSDVDDDGDDDDEKEMSIYDQGASTAVRRSSHKASVSSEVEVLLVEEGDVSISIFEDSATDTSLTVDKDMGGGGKVEEEGGGGGGGDDDGIMGGNGGYDFKHLDHRLALYLMMTVFDNSEEFKFKVKTCVCQYMMWEEYEALVAVTNLKLYILRINTEDASVELNEALTLMEAQPHAELKRVDVGLGHQTLRLEFVSDCSSYTLVMRDGEKVDAFAELLREVLQMYSQETGMPSAVVFNEGADQETLDILSADVLNKGSNTQQSLLLYSLGCIARGHNPQYPIAFVVSSSEVCLVKPNHQWPSPQYQTRVTVDSVGKQFTVLERQKINNIATVEVNEVNQHRMRVTFFNESSGDETRWFITMATNQGVRDLIEAVRDPWEKAFGVPLDVETSAFDLSF